MNLVACQSCTPFPLCITRTADSEVLKPIYLIAIFYDENPDGFVYKKMILKEILIILNHRKGDFGVKNEDIGPENAYFLNVNLE